MADANANADKDKDADADAGAKEDIDAKSLSQESSWVQKEGRMKRDLYFHCH